ncbi:Phosphonoacetate hydrolase [Teratosphaeria destructans]|uniref:Phosphonoacetate hydrolase n=1 Tax=Teratosphaeria destructans TaxID=418781 RepID=A0A9W7SMH7_9PEZI|nr:Phosphonoacetate hydrolase [Teratosphaeria destructans]
MTGSTAKYHASAGETVAELFSVIARQGNSDYLGEQVSQLEHSLQAAILAQNAGADSDTELGALLHDVGRFIPAADKMPPMIALDGTFFGTASHEVVGEKYLRHLGFSEKICQLVAAHVMAKRYLTAVDKNYYDGLSQSSKTTLKFQGGPFTAQGIEAAQHDPWLDLKLAVRRWDDRAKDPDLRTPSLWSFQEMAVDSLAASRTTAQT